MSGYVQWNANATGVSLVIEGDVHVSSPAVLDKAMIIKVGRKGCRILVTGNLTIRPREGFTDDEEAAAVAERMTVHDEPAL
jgi:hypothetical protein